MTNNIRIAVTHEARARIAFEIAVGLSKILPDCSEVSISYGFGNSSLGGLGAPRFIGEGRFDVAFVNPSPVTYMALNGLEPYTDKTEIRNLAVFPSWDRIGFAVKRSLGVNSLKEIGDRKIPLRLSTRGQGPDGTTVLTIRKILNFYGWSVEDIESWGGTLDRVPVPGHPMRAERLKQGLYDSVFDEGIRRWVEPAMDQEMILLPLEETVFSYMERFGFGRTTIPKASFKGLKDDVPALEFGGWSLFCRADFPEDLAYAVVKAIDMRKETIPVDGDRLDMNRICRDTPEGPFCIPLHPGAERYYKEKGYLEL
jgi:TRAP-type uncharacterized transport system substrate-binding protein